MDKQTRIGIGAAALIAMMALLEPHLIHGRPAWALPIYLLLAVVTVWGFVPIAKSIIDHLRGTVVGEWGPWVLIGLGVVGAIWLTVSHIDRPSRDAHPSALAKLAELGWTVKPGPDDIQFVISSQPLPPMKESAAQFERLAKPFNLHFQQVAGLEGLHYLANIVGCTKIEINAGGFTDISELRGFVHLTNLGISQLPLNGTGTVDLSPLSSLTNLQQLNLGMVRARTIDALAPLKGLKSLNLGQTLISDISVLSDLTLLETLEIRGTRVSDLRPLSQAQNLRELTIGGAQVPSLANLAHLPNLKKLTLIEQQGFDLSGVGALTNLVSLWILGGQPQIDVLPLRNLTKLHALSIMGLGFGRPLTFAPNVEAIGDLKELRTLTLGQLQIIDLNFVASLTNLNEINLNQLPLASIASLRGLTSLKKISLVDIPVVDISLLLELPALTDLTVGRTPARSDVLSELGRRGVKVTSW